MAIETTNRLRRLAQVAESFGIYSETFVYDTADELSKQLETEYRLFTFNRQNKDVFKAGHVITIDAGEPGKLDTLAAKIKSKMKSAPYQSRSWRTRRESLEKKLCEFKPEVIHVHFGPLGVVVAPIAKRLNIPMFVTFHGYDISRLLRDSRWLNAYKQLRSPNIFAIGVSNHICKKIEKIGIKKSQIRCIHGGIRLSKFPYDPPLPRFDGKLVKLLCVGRMVDKKAPIELLEAFEIAKTRMSSERELRLTWVGDGPLRGKVDKFISDNNLHDCVELTGAQPHSFVQRAFRTHHLYTQMACTAPDGDEEGQGITLVEAGATGLPVLTTRHNGFPDVIEDGETGILHDEHDVAAVGETIARLASAPHQWDRISQNARRRVEKKFTVENQISTMIEHFNQITKTTSRT